MVLSKHIGCVKKIVKDPSREIREIKENIIEKERTDLSIVRDCALGEKHMFFTQEMAHKRVL